MIVLPLTAMAPIEIVEETVEKPSWKKPVLSLLTDWKLMLKLFILQLLLRLPANIISEKTGSSILAYLISYGYLGFITFRIVYQLLSYMLYSYPTTMMYEPTVTVIMPVYNEESLIQQSVESVLDSHYPKEKLELIVIDDGSTDNTWSELIALSAKRLGEFTLLRNPRNLGKRHAMGRGIREARGEIIITVDSDTILEPNSIAEIVKGFKDEKTGAISGRVLALNTNENLVTKALSIRYLLASDFDRATESTFGIVQTCNGPFSAYRKHIILPHLHEWMNQTFMGVKTTNGDDKSLTTIVLKEGYDVHYAKNAVAKTKIANTLKGVFNTFTRWNRSYLRETILMILFLFKTKQYKKRPLLTFNVLFTNALLLGFYFGMVSGLFLLLLHPETSLTFFAMLAYSIALLGLYYAQFQEKITLKIIFYNIVYSLIHVTIGVAAMLRAAFTISNNRWLTR